MKRLLSILLSIAMCASLLPMTALAAKENPNETVPYYFCDTEGELFEDEFYFDEENNTFYLTGKSWSEGAKVSLDEYDKEFVTMTESEEPSGMKFTINVTEIETEETIEVEVDDYTLELDLINDSTEVFFCREVEIEEEGIEEARQNLKKLSLESGESVYVKFYSVKPSQMKNAKTALDLVSGTFDQGGVLTISHEEKYEDVWFIEAADEINDDVNLTLTMTGTGENETYTMPVTVEPLEDGDTDMIKK